MKKVTKKKSSSLEVTYGIKAEMAPTLRYSDSIVKIDLGWISLDFGWDERWNEILFAVTKKDTVLMSSPSVASKHLSGTDKSCEWVYAIDFLPPDFCDGLKQKAYLTYGGFHILHGVDSDDRNFLCVEMPNAELHLLFRDPAEPNATAWYPPRAISLDRSMVISSMARAKDLEFASLESKAVNAELDRLLAEPL